MFNDFSNFKIILSFVASMSEEGNMAMSFFSPVDSAEKKHNVTPPPSCPTLQDAQEELKHDGGKFLLLCFFNVI